MTSTRDLKMKSHLVLEVYIYSCSISGAQNSCTNWSRTSSLCICIKIAKIFHHETVQATENRQTFLYLQRGFSRNFRDTARSCFQLSFVVFLHPRVLLIPLPSPRFLLPPVVPLSTRRGESFGETKEVAGRFTRRFNGGRGIVKTHYGIKRGGGVKAVCD